MLSLRMPFLGKGSGRRSKRRAVSKKSERELLAKRTWVLGVATCFIAIASLLSLPVIHSYYTPSAQAALAPKATPVVDLNAVKNAQAIHGGYNHGTGLLTEMQLNALAKINPALHSKLTKANGSNKAIVVSYTEAKIIQSLTQKSQMEIKAAGANWAAMIPALVIAFLYVYPQLTGKQAPASDFLTSLLTAFVCIITLGASPLCAGLAGPGKSAT